MELCADTLETWKLSKVYHSHSTLRYIYVACALLNSFQRESIEFPEKITEPPVNAAQSNTKMAKTENFQYFLDEVLGIGAFGVVYGGLLNG